ncbi:MAG: DUF3426 domain-containing protein [Rhodocyclaceae bacterium]|nr:DUF3426 domain-containing protein [Rhodocyclaceae bacterium]MDZ4214420.1 DUF3426 domain-containing protein [Rhodocyclaceae bacterium]
MLCLRKFAGAFAIALALSSLGCDSKQRARDNLVSRGVTDYSQARFLQAVGEANTEIVKLFLDAGMDANAREDKLPGCPAVVPAIRADSADTLKTLVERGADINAKCADGNSPLIYAARSGKLWGTEILLNAGANPNVPDSNGLTALNHSQFLQLSDVSALLQSRGAKLGKLRNAQLLTIDFSEVMPLPQDKQTLVLTAMLRNHADYPSEFPRLRISFTDSKNTEVFATVLQPADYMKPPPAPDTVWSPRATLDIKTEFRMPPNADGYRVFVMSFDETLGR